MTKKTWLDDYDKRCAYRESLTSIINNRSMVRDTLCVLDEYEMVLAQLATVKAERDNLRAERGALVAEVTRLREALAPFAVLGCSDGNCMFRDSRGGQHTNGGCRCLLTRSLQQQRETLCQLIETARAALAGSKDE